MTFRPYHIVFTLCLFALNSHAQTRQDKYEKQLCQCIYENYAQVGVDIKKNLDDFEAYLVSSGILKDKSGSSYRSIFEQLHESDHNPLQIDYELEGVDFVTDTPYSRCFWELKQDPKFKASDSRMNRLLEAIDIKNRGSGALIKHLTSGVMNTLSAEDFELEAYRIYALHTFYFIADPVPKNVLPLPKADYPIITIKISDEESIFIDGKEVPLNVVSKRVNELTGFGTDDELYNVEVVLRVAASVKMELVSDLIQELKKTNINSIDYQTLE